MAHSVSRYRDQATSMKTVNYHVYFYRPSVVCYNRYRLAHRWVPEMVLNVQSESLLRRSLTGNALAHLQSRAVGPALKTGSRLLRLYGLAALRPALSKVVELAN